MIAHTSLAVGNYRKSKEFYIKALAPLGYSNNMEYGEAAGFNDGKNTDFWIAKQDTVVPTHVVARTMAARATGPSTGPATTPRSCTTLTATTSRLSGTTTARRGKRTASSLRVTRAVAMKVQLCRLLMTLAALIWCVPSAGASDEGGEDGLLVFAAASLTDVLDEIGKVYESTTGKRVKFSFAASSALARQIEAGARADPVFSGRS